MLNWNSLNIPSYMSNVYSRLRQVDLLVKQVNDIRDARIDAVLLEISETVLCELPKDDPWTIDEFITKTQVRRIQFNPLSPVDISIKFLLVKYMYSQSERLWELGI